MLVQLIIESCALVPLIEHVIFCSAQVAELLEERTAADTDLTVYRACGHVPMDDSRAEFEEDLKNFTQLCMNTECRSIAEADINSEGTQHMPQASTSSSM